ncbi:MAG: outer membrane beta-barrel protein [Lentimicrobium sp.]|nr:outer membrane beta-barrel protein [Lentimicrobium sp.]
MKLSFYRLISKNLSLLVIVLLISGSLITKNCSAQAALMSMIFGDKVATENFHTSLDLGMNFSALPGLDKGTYKHGFYLGLGTFIKMNEKWALTPEFKPLSQRGARKVNPIRVFEGVADPRYDIILNYIDVPVLVQYRISTKLFVSAGPQISLLTKALQSTAGTAESPHNDVKILEDFTDSFNRLYLSIPLEIGYSIHDISNNQDMNIKIRYCIGLNEVIADEAFASSNISSFQVFLSFPFMK